MADRHLDPSHGGALKSKIQRAARVALPEWQVFIRRPDGRSDQFTLTRGRQLWLLAGIAGVSLWASAATMMLAHQPEELASKERQLEELMASYHSAQHRLTAAYKMVGDITREIDTVHTNLEVLAQSNAALAKDRPGAGADVPKVHIASDPAYDENGQPGASEAKATRDEVHKLEASLDRLKVTYSKVVQYTADQAGQRIAEAQHSLQHLGLDPDHLASVAAKDVKGRGGPYVAMPGQPAMDSGLDTLVDRMGRWDNMKAALQAVPLAEPLHQSWEVNSPYGARNDPLNTRTGFHEGVDMGAPYGTPVYATGAGVVRMAGPYDRYGLCIDVDHGNGLMTRYAHLAKIKVVVGQKVSRATVIGLLGNSGRTTGAHLHYEVRVADSPKDPLKFISAGHDVPKAR